MHISIDRAMTSTTFSINSRYDSKFLMNGCSLVSRPFVFSFSILLIICFLEKRNIGTAEGLHLRAMYCSRLQFCDSFYINKSQQIQIHQNCMFSYFYDVMWISCHHFFCLYFVVNTRMTISHKRSLYTFSVNISPKWETKFKNFYIKIWTWRPQLATIAAY